VRDVIADRFVLERRVGAGGMGAVYRALDRTSGVCVALKLALADDERLRARALAEADALAALDHPGVVRLVAHGVAGDGRAFLAMEWLDGEDLAARLARAPLAAGEAALLGTRVADALAAVHARGVVHRDVKPSNLFLAGGEVARVKLVDFGIARLSGASPRLTTTGTRIGTPGYMAPEQLSSDAEVGPPADLFALGAVLFECLAGQPAFQGMSVLALLAKVLLDEPPRLDRLRADLPSSLVELVARLLAKNPGERPGAAQVAVALSALAPALQGAAAAALAPAPALDPAAVTVEEQQLVSVLLVRPAEDPLAEDPLTEERGDARGSIAAVPSVALDATLPAGAITASSSGGLAAFERLRAVAAPLGGRTDARLAQAASEGSASTGRLRVATDAWAAGVVTEDTGAGGKAGPQLGFCTWLGSCRSWMGSSSALTQAARVGGAYAPGQRHPWARLRPRRDGVRLPRGRVRSLTAKEGTPASVHVGAPGRCARWPQRIGATALSEGRLLLSRRPRMAPWPRRPAAARSCSLRMTSVAHARGSMLCMRQEANTV